MAINFGNSWLRNGDSMWFALWFDGANQTDMGAQWMMANPLPLETFPELFGTTQLETGRFQKRVYVDATTGGSGWHYNILVENSAAPGWNPTWFNVQGGGNT